MLGQSVVGDAWLGDSVTDRYESTECKSSFLELAVYCAGSADLLNPNECYVANTW